MLNTMLVSLSHGIEKLPRHVNYMLSGNGEEGNFGLFDTPKLTATENERDAANRRPAARRPVNRVGSGISGG